MINVFISHNYKDKPMARRLADLLTNYGIKAWIDESEIKIGDSLIEKIRSGLDYMDYLVVLISKNSVESEWVKKELDIAMNREIEGKRVVTVPILAGKCELPGFLKGKLYADMSTAKKFKENIPRLLNRFNVSEIGVDKKLYTKNLFTEYRLNAVQVIEKIENTKNEDELIDFLENFEPYDRSIFYRDTFISTINNVLNDSETSVDLLVSVIEICNYCPDDLIIKISLTHFLNHSDEQILQSTICALKGKKHLKIQQKKILSLLKSCKSRDLEKCIWDYFNETSISSEIANSLWRYIEERVESNYNNEILVCMGKLFSILDDEKILEKWYILWEQGNESEKSCLVDCLSKHIFESIALFLKNPKLRYDLHNAFLRSLDDKDSNNNELMISLLTSEGNIFDNRKEIWDILIDKDEYTIEYIFQEKEDVDGLRRIVEKVPNNTHIKELVYDIIANIPLKDALDVIEKEKSFVITHRHVPGIIYTIIRRSDVKEYKELFERTKKVLKEDKYPWQNTKNLVCFGDYLLGNLQLEEMISNLVISQEEYRNHLKLISNVLLKEKLISLEKQDTTCSKRIKELINEIDSYIHTED